MFFLKHLNDIFFLLSSVTMDPHWFHQRFFGSAKNARILCTRFAKLRAIGENKNLFVYMHNKFH